MLRHLPRETIVADWAAHRARPALPGAVAIALCLVGSMALGHPQAGMAMAVGALPVGFGAFQIVGRSRVAPMLLAAFGVAMAALLFSMVPRTYGALGAAAALAGFYCGLLSALGPGWTWVGLQTSVAALIASGYPARGHEAAVRALLILAGGLLQFGVVLLFWKLHPPFFVVVEDEAPSGPSGFFQRLRAQLTWRSQYLRYGVHLALALGFGTLLVHFLGLQNGYWVPMTILLILRTDAQQTIGRGVARVVGTLVGAGLATLLAGALHPNGLIVGLLAALFAWLCYSLLSVNYGIFSVCLTAYIVFLLAFGGFPTRAVAGHRLANTALGGAVALLSYGPHLLRARWPGRK